jgi:peptidoglycan/LPS O-acetylase OafA/YrhL
VYPAYWIYTTLFILAAYLGLGYPDFSWEPFNLIASYLLLPAVSDVTLPLKVAWTLVYEIRFYLIFLILIVFGWRALWVFWAWGAAILVLFLTGSEVTDLFSPWNLYFIAGMIGFLALNHLHGKQGIYLLMLGVSLTILYGFLSQDVERIAHLNRERPELHFLLAPAFLALILGVVTIEKSHSINPPNWLKFLGDASYSIYLVHSAAISALVLIFEKTCLMEIIGIRPTFLIIFILSVIVGSLAYIIVEKPLIRLFQKLGGRRKRVKAKT